MNKSLSIAFTSTAIKKRYTGVATGIGKFSHGRNTGTAKHARI